MSKNWGKRQNLEVAWQKLEAAELITYIRKKSKPNRSSKAKKIQFKICKKT
jgi:hypothetical protein